jgi:serine/threonine protein kinase/Tfp pilus assembly protein PilF
MQARSGEDLPVLNSSSEPDLLGQLAEEFLERYRRGERPALTEYTARHPELAEQIRELFGALVLMEDVRPVPATVVDAAKGAPAGTGAPQRLGEYRIVREIGRGGMGVVYEAVQESLGRRVALKVLPAGALGDARHVERFQREARAAARLHHSNIVPVFAVCQDSGTHYYVMQYIEGRPLDEVLAELRRLRAEGGRQTAPLALDTSAAADVASGAAPSDEAASRYCASLARSLWQGQFRAASRPDGRAPDPAEPAPAASSPSGSAPTSGLLADPHGPFAQRVAQLGIQVAEALEYAAAQGVLHRDVKPSNLLLDVFGTVWLTDFGLAKAAGTPDLTRPGDLLGTLRYMAPERFDGRADVRSDVYALGLTLYELLALRPAFAAQDQAELIRQISAAEVPRLDRLDRRPPRDLVTIVHKAMAREPAARYQSAAALAEDLRRFVENRSIVARRASLAEQTWRWCRRNPTVAGLLAALLALVTVAVGGGLWLERQQAEQRGRAREAVEAALAQVPGLRRHGRWSEAHAILTQARSRLDDAGSDDLRRRLGRAEEDVQLAAELEQIRLTPAVIEGEFDFRGMARAYARALEHAGLDVMGDEEIVAGRIRDSDVRPQLVVALDHWAFVAEALGDRRLRARLLDLSCRADLDPEWGDRFRDSAVWEDQGQLHRLAADAQKWLSQEARGKGPPTQLLILLAMKLGKAEEEAELLLRAAQRQHPEDFWLNYALGKELRERKPAEAVGYYRAALATRPSVAAVYHEMGLALLWQRQVDEAILAFRKAIELEPKGSWHYTNLGVCLRDKGRLDEAMANYRRAIELNPEVAAPHTNLGVCLRDTGRLDEAMVECRRAIELRPNAMPAHLNLGMCLRDKGRFDEAMAEYCRAIELDPNATAGHYQLGLLLESMGRPEEAILEFREVTQREPRVALAHEALTRLLLQRGRFAEARRAVLHGLDQVPADEPRRKVLQQQLDQCDHQLALGAGLPAMLREKEQPAGAAEQLRLARLCREFGRPYTAARFYAAAFAARPALADDLRSANRYDAACAAVRAAAEPGPDEPRPGEPERASLRRQALAWLRADLAAWTRLQQGAKASGWPQRIWRTDAALASVRDRAPLEKLPQEERTQWRRLWADVAALPIASPRDLEQARAHAARREWRQAADCYAQTVRFGPGDEGHFWLEYAAVLLLCGDRPGYAKACARMVERCGKTPDVRAYHVARACTLAPDSVADGALPGRLAQKELAASAGEFWSLTERGALHYRAGRFHEAVPLFEQSLRADAKAGRAVLNWLWLALAHHRLGQADEARRWLGRAQAWLDQYGGGMPGGAEEELGLHLHNWLEAHVLRREAEALLGDGPAKAKEPGPAAPRKK